jgi:hypothetical protein
MARKPEQPTDLEKAARQARYILKDIDPHEFSLVPVGENGKRFFLLKSHNDEEVDAMKVEEIVKSVLDGDLSDESRLDEIMKSASLAEDSQQAVKAALRLLTATEIPTEVRKSLLETAGLIPEEKEEVVEKAAEAVSEEEAPAVSENDNEPGGEEMNEVFKGLSLSAEDQEKLEAHFAAIEKSAAEKIEKLEKSLTDERDVRLNKEYIAKAAEFENLDITADEFGPVLKELSERYPEGYDKITHVLKSADIKIGESRLFDEIGTSEQNEAGTDPYMKLEKMASELVEKSAGQVSLADARNSVLQTSEGSKLYAEYERQRAGRA